jgi:hypothetical protein
MKPDSIVIISLHSPKEKIWGILLDINPSGVTIRGIDLNSFDHFVSQINQLDAERVGLPTVFFPMTRIERISLDEPSGSIPSMAEIFERPVRLICAILAANERPHLDGTQSDHFFAPRFSAVFPDPHSV